MGRLDKLKREAINEANKRVLGEQINIAVPAKLSYSREIKDKYNPIGY